MKSRLDNLWSECLQGMQKIPLSSAQPLKQSSRGAWRGGIERDGEKANKLDSFCCSSCSDPKQAAVTGTRISLSITHAKSGTLTRGACCKAASASSNIQRTDWNWLERWRCVCPGWEFGCLTWVCTCFHPILMYKVRVSYYPVTPGWFLSSWHKRREWTEPCGTMMSLAQVHSFAHSHINI